MKRTTCEECKGKVIRKKAEYKYLGEHMGNFEADVCTKCGEKVFDEDTSDKIECIVKKKGLYGLGARTRVGKVGTSLDVKINKRLAEFLNLKKGTEVRIYPENKKKLIISI